MVPKLKLLFFILLLSNIIHCSPDDVEEEINSKKGSKSYNKIFHGHKVEEVRKIIQKLWKFLKLLLFYVKSTFQVDTVPLTDTENNECVSCPKRRQRQCLEFAEIGSKLICVRFKKRKIRL